MLLTLFNVININIKLDIQKKNIFPDRPEEAAMFGCESLSV